MIQRLLSLIVCVDVATSTQVPAAAEAQGSLSFHTCKKAKPAGIFRVSRIVERALTLVYKEDFLQ